MTILVQMSSNKVNYLVWRCVCGQSLRPGFSGGEGQGGGVGAGHGGS